LPLKKKYKNYCVIGEEATAARLGVTVVMAMEK
jgi:hypothetical protein